MIGQATRNQFLSQSRTAGLFALFALVVVVSNLVGLVLFSGLVVNPDSGMYLVAAIGIFQGSVPFVDLIDLNPPMVQYLHIVPVLISRLLSAQPATVFHLLVAVLVLYSGWALFRGISESSPDWPIPSRLFVTASWILFATLPMTIGGFGQREHLFILTYIPWLYCREARHRGIRVGSWFAAILGLTAGPFMLLKPHFLLMAGGLEAWMLFRSRRWATLLSAEVTAVIIWGLAYVSHFALVPHPMRTEFFGRWVPFVVLNYGVYNCTWSNLLLTGLLPYGLIPLSLLAGSLIGLAGSRRVSPDLRLRTETLSLGILLGLAIYLLQHKGWPYQLFPAAGFSALLFATLWVEFVQHLSAARGRFVKFTARFCVGAFSVACLLLALAAGPVAMRVWAIGKRERAHMQPYLDLIRKYSQPGDAVAFIDTTPMTFHPLLLYSERKPGVRYLVAFPIPMLYKGSEPIVGDRPAYRTEKQWPEQERRFLDEMRSDILVQRPILVFVQARGRCWGCPPGFRVDAYLKASGWWRQAMGHYKPLTRIGLFDVYRRVNGSGPATQ